MPCPVDDPRPHCAGGIDWDRDTLNRLYKAPTDYTKPQKHYTKPLNIRQRPKTLDKTFTKACKTQKY